MAGTSKRLSVVLDHKLLAEARRLTCSRTKRATIAKALEELVKVDTHALPGVALSEFKLRLSGVLLTRRTPDLAHTPVLPGGDLSLN